MYHSSRNCFNIPTYCTSIKTQQKKIIKYIVCTSNMHYIDIKKNNIIDQK